MALDVPLYGDAAKMEPLEIREDLPHQLRSWRFQRIGWIVCAGVTVAAFAGVFGDGPLAERKAFLGGYLVRYETPIRSSSKSAIRVAASDSKEAPRVRIQPRGGQRDLGEIEFFPPPKAMDATPEVVTALYGANSRNIEIRFSPERSGVYSFDLTLGAETRMFTVLALP